MAATHAAAFSHSRGWSAEEFASLLAGKGCFAIGDARSFALVRVIAGEAELLTLATDPAHRRQGLAAAAMQAWLDAARALGGTEAFLEVAADNRPALALYRRFGFAEDGRRPGYYRNNDGSVVDALLMRRALAG